MSGPNLGNLHRKQYEDALHIYNDGNGDIDKSIAEARKNLTDTTLPPFYIIKNCILSVCALDNWDIADVWLLTAEQQYRNSVTEATRKQDTNSLEALAGLRKGLDEVKKYKIEDFASMTKEERDMLGVENDVDEEETAIDMLDDDDDVEDLAGMDLEHAEAVAMAENKMEATAEHLCLPIHPASSHSLEVMPSTGDEHDTTVAHKSCLQKNTPSNEGGTFYTY